MESLRALKVIVWRMFLFSYSRKPLEDFSQRTNELQFIFFKHKFIYFKKMISLCTRVEYIRPVNVELMVRQ